LFEKTEQDAKERLAGYKRLASQCGEAAKQAAAAIE